MSGGVDSSVAAYLMQQKGYTCVGATMLLCTDLVPEGTVRPARDAELVAKSLGMEFHVLNALQEFKEQVVNYFIDTYEEGLTPNPCMRCNRHMKFSYLLSKAQELGCDYIATGHYANIRKDEKTGRYLLCRAADTNKDQSYFLSCLTQYQLAHTIFPLGNMSGKDETREIAAKAGLITAQKHDSQDVCFIPDGDYMAFMERYTGKTYPEGDFLDLNGKKIGTHHGAVRYTLGQRKGLGLAMGEPVYVCGKDMCTNTVTVGPESVLFSHALRANDWNWGPFETLTQPIRAMVKARYRHIPQPATAYPEENSYVRIVFDTPQRAITPGQAVVLYDGDVVVGGGTITEAIN